MSEEIDLATVAIPKGLRLNADKRLWIAREMVAATRAEKALSKKELLAAGRELTDRLLTFLWTHPETGVDLRTAMIGLPDGVLAKVDRVGIYVPTRLTNEDAISDQKYWANQRMFELIGVDAEGEDACRYFEVPAWAVRYSNAGVRTRSILFAEGEDEKKAAINRHGSDGVLLPDDLGKDLVEHMLYEAKLNDMEERLRDEIYRALNAFKSVAKLRDGWPEAFETYMLLYSDSLKGNENALTVASQVVSARRLIDNFPDEPESVIAA